MIDYNGLTDEKIILELLDAHPESDVECQVRGIDGYLSSGATVDVKATRKWRGSFSVELYYHDVTGYGRIGWMYDEEFENDYLALSTIDYDTGEYEIILVNKKELRAMLDRYTSIERLFKVTMYSYANDIKEFTISDNIKVVISNQLKSKPANIVIKKTMYENLPGTRIVEGYLW